VEIIHKRWIAKLKVKKKILHITHNMAVGGAEQVIRQLIRAMDSSKYESSVICIDGYIGVLGEDLQKNGVMVESISRKAGFDRAVVETIRSKIKNNNYDVVHCHQYTPFCYGAVASAFLKVKVIFTEHGRFHPDRFTWKRRIVNQILHRQAEQIVAISTATKVALKRYEWIPLSSVEVIYNGVDEPVPERRVEDIRRIHGIADDAMVLGTISRLDSIKNQRMMLLALVKVLPKYPNTVLIIAGDGPERAELESIVATCGIENNVRFTGFITDVGAYLKTIDVFLLTSYSEGTSMTLLEAMACSNAIIATAVGGNVEIIENKHSGILVESGNIDALWESLELLLGDRNLRERLGDNANTEYQARFTRRSMLLAYEKHYR